MGAIDNAVSLMNSSDLLDKIKAAAVYQARVVVTEPVATPNHATRLKMALACIYNPMQHAQLFTNIVACDPDICTTTGDPTKIADATLLTKMASIWDPVATALYPVTG